MTVTVVVGGQYGGEGKGKICAHLAMTDDIDIMVRCGGPNSGHTVDLAGKRYELKQVPAGFVNPRTLLFIAAGALVGAGAAVGATAPDAAVGAGAAVALGAAAWGVAVADDPQATKKKRPNIKDESRKKPGLLNL